MLPALAVNLVLTSAAPRTGQMTLWFASGHAHVFFQRGAQPEQFHAHEVVHVHAFDADVPVTDLPVTDVSVTDVSVTDVSVSDPHRHACIDVGLVGGDWRPSVKAQGDHLLALLWVPSVPLVSSVAEGAAVPHLRLASPSPLGVPPPDLLRSTILLI